MLFHRKTIFVTQFLSHVYQISFGAHCIRFGVSLQHVRSYMNVQARACNYQCQRQKFYAQNSRQLYTCARSNGLFSRKLTPTSFILAAAPAASKLSHSDVGLQADSIITQKQNHNTNNFIQGSFICFYRIFRIFEKLEDPSSNFPNFRKAVFQFRISLAAVK